HFIAKQRDRLIQTGDSYRRWSHIDASTTRSKVHGYADYSCLLAHKSRLISNFHSPTPSFEWQDGRLNLIAKGSANKKIRLQRPQPRGVQTLFRVTSNCRRRLAYPLQARVRRYRPGSRSLLRPESLGHNRGSLLAATVCRRGPRSLRGR